MTDDYEGQILLHPANRGELLGRVGRLTIGALEGLSVGSGAGSDVGTGDGLNVGSAEGLNVGLGEGGSGSGGMHSPSKHVVQPSVALVQSLSS